jgi:hypothetical protein
MATERKHWRGANRHQAGWIGTYRLDDQSESWGECRVLDLSSTGAALELFGTLPRAVDRIVVDLEVGQDLQFVGSIRHRRYGDDAGVVVGVQFIEASVPARERLASLLERQSA